jgi:hypothetical protein
LSKIFIMNIIQGAFRSLFGFGKNNNYYTMQQIGQSTPDWITTTDLFKVYKDIPELAIVVNRKASMIASANPIIVDAEGNKIDPNGHWMFEIIDRPTPMLSWGRVMQMVSINLSITNNAVLFSPQRIAGIHNQLNPIAFNNVKINYNKKGLKQTSVEGFIESFELAVNSRGTFETFKPQDVVYIAEMDGINQVNTESLIHGLKLPLTNIKKSHEKKNVILKNMFALGILTSGATGDISALNSDPNEIEKVRKDLKKRHNGEIIVTDQPLNWNPMSYPMKDLLISEGIWSDFVTLCNAYGLNENIFGNILGKGSTFANVDGGERQTYTATIIPQTEFIYDEITQQLGLNKVGMFLKPDFSHIDVLKKDEKAAADTSRIEIEKLSKMLSDGIITPEQYAEMANVELTQLTPKEKQAQSLQNAQTNLRGTVGGLQGIISLNSAVGLGQMSRESAVNTLVNYYGYDQQTANSMITNTTNPERTDV